MSLHIFIISNKSSVLITLLIAPVKDQNYTLIFNELPSSQRVPFFQGFRDHFLQPSKFREFTFAHEYTEIVNPTGELYILPPLHHVVSLSTFPFYTPKPIFSLATIMGILRSKAPAKYLAPTGAATLNRS